jgi:hypothetical protein
MREFIESPVGIKNDPLPHRTNSTWAM